MNICTIRSIPLSISNIFTSSLALKGPKHEKFVAGIFTQIRPVWIGIGELETRYIFILIGEIFSDFGDSSKNFLAMSATALKSTK